MNHFLHTTAPTRRRVLGGLAALAAAAGGRGGARAQGAKFVLPSAPVGLNIVDVAGNLQLSKPMLDGFARANPKLVSRITTSQAPAPELPGKIRAQQQAGRVDIDMVLTGTDGLSAGIDQKLWVPLVADGGFDALMGTLLPAARRMQSLAEGQGMIIAYYPSGPLLEYMPDKVATPPKTAQDLLEWTRAHKNRFFYARPANSGPGRTWLMGLPYILGDKDPKDPEHGWDKTWPYLQELGRNIEYYPTGTTATMKELGEGSRDMIVTTTGWDINPRVLGVVPKEAKVAALDGFHWVGDAHYAVVPNGVPDDKLAVLIQLVHFMLQPPQQAFNYDRGYFYPGPVVQGVTLAMAPQESQDAIHEFGRPEYDRLIADHPVELPLDAQRMVYAFRRWDEQVGSKVGQ